MTRASLSEKRPPTWLLAVFTLLPLAVLLVLRDHLSPHSSDDVAVQVVVNSWLRGLHHRTYLPSDNYLFKLPVYVIAELLPFSPHIRLLLQVLVLNLASFAAFLLALRWLVTPPRATHWDRTAVFVPTLWLTLIGGAFGLDMMVANYRNLELGLIFLVIAYLHRYVTGEGKPRWSWLATGTLILSFFWFSDPYFLLLVGLPLIGFMWIWYGFRERSSRLLLSSLLLAGSALISYVWKPLAAWFGIEIGGGASLSPADILHNLALLWPSLCSLLNLHLGSPVRILISALTLAVAIAGLAASITNAWSGWRDRRFVLFFAGTQWLVIIGGFAVSSYVFDIGAGRYLVLIPFYIALNLSLALSRLPRRTIHTVVVALLLVASCASVISDLHELTNPRLYPGTTAQNHTLAMLRSSGLTKGYAQYWSANINTYLDNGRPTVVPIDCVAGQIKPLYWFMDDAAFRRPARASFYLYEDNVPQAVACPLAALEQDFGQPVRIITVNAHDSLLIYNYDIARRFVETASPRY